MDVKETFKGHHEEIRRRVATKDACDGELPSTSTFERVVSDKLDDPFVLPEQKFVVFSLSHREFAPCPEDPSTPAVCVYGTFETQSEAYEHARQVQTKHPHFSLLVDQTHKWIAAVATVARLTDAEYVRQKTDTMLAAVETRRKRNDDDFRRNVEARSAGEVSTATEDDAGGGVEETADGEKQTQKVHRSCAVPEQHVCVVSFVCDPADADAEFLFRVYAAYDNEKQADQYSMNVCADHVRDHDIDVIRTCAWAFPHRMQSKHVPRECFRNEELNNVMKAHKKAPQEVERFYREWEMVQKQEDGEPATTSEVGGDTAPVSEPDVTS